MSCNCDGLTCLCGLPCDCPLSPCGCTNCINSPKQLCSMCGKRIDAPSSVNSCTCFTVPSQQPLQTSAPQQGSSTGNSSSTSKSEKGSRSTKGRKNSKRPATEDSNVQKNKDCVVSKQPKEQRVALQSQTLNSSTSYGEKASTTKVRKNSKRTEDPEVEKNKDCVIVKVVQPKRTRPPTQSQTLDTSQLKKGLDTTKLKISSGHRIKEDPDAKKSDDCGVSKAEEMTTSETNANTDFRFLTDMDPWTVDPGVMYCRYSYQVCKRCNKLFSFRIVQPFQYLCSECSVYPDNTYFPCTPPTSPLSYDDNVLGYNLQYVNNQHCQFSSPQTIQYGDGLNQNVLGCMDQAKQKNEIINKWLENANIFPYR